MLDLVKIEEFLEYIEKLNKALDSIGWGGRFIPATFSPKIGVIVGHNAKAIANHLFLSGKLERFYELRHKGASRKIFAVQLKE